jgi:hypothetical protein
MTRPALAALLGGFLLVGCAARPPTGPTVLAVPPEGKDLAQFQGEEANCRNYAFNQIGVGGPTTGADPAIGSAVGGTVLGAAAGTLLGAAAGSPGAGAAVGAGAGLLTGSAAGANNAQTTSYGLQLRYDQAYAQCLASTGNQVQTAAAFASPYYYPAHPYYGGFYGPYAGGFYGPGFFGPRLGFGLGIGIGGYRHFGPRYGGFRHGGGFGGGFRPRGFRH